MSFLSKLFGKKCKCDSGCDCNPDGSCNCPTEVKAETPVEAEAPVIETEAPSENTQA